ncbi:MAG: TetR family transcriptional regulator [Acidimicrobiales bacterium]
MVSTRRRAGRKSRRDEVLAAALSLFRAEGVMSVSPTDVGRAVDMTATAIRYHFPTTDDLLLALTDDLFDDLEAAMATYPDDPDWPDGVIPMVTDFVNVVLEHRDAALLIRQDGYLLSLPSSGTAPGDPRQDPAGDHRPRPRYGGDRRRRDRGGRDLAADRGARTRACGRPHRSDRLGDPQRSSSPQLSGRRRLTTWPARGGPAWR